MANLKLEHIYKVYPNGTKAVNDISLDIENGEFIVFVGPSGCGKSTTLRMIAGLEEITAGELYIDNQIVNDVEPKDRDIAMVFQNYALYPHMTVYENMAFGLKLRHVPTDIIQEKVLWAADILGIKEYLDRKPRNMSGGQRQRVALGRAILRDPKVMLLDEPLSNLDAKLRTQMRTEIAKLHQKLKTTFIYVTHDQTEAMTLGDRVVVMKGGRIQQVDSPKNLYNYPNNKFVAGFIGTPQMNFFPVTLKRDGEHVNVHFKDNDSDISFSYNQLIKVLPSYLDGNHDIVFGIRCESISIVKDEDESTIKVKVSHFEELGSECLVYGSIKDDGNSLNSLSGQIIIKVTSIDDIKPGDVINAKFDMERGYFFDEKSEETILPRIPEYNSFTASIKEGKIQILGQEIPLPKALNVLSNDDCELCVPTDAIIFNHEGLKAKVEEIETISDIKLAHLSCEGRTFFGICKEDIQIGAQIDVGIDFTKVKLLDKNGEILFEPIAAFDCFDANFYNFNTVIEKTNNQEYVKFRDDKMKACRDFLDAKIMLEDQNYEKKRLALDNSNIEEEKNKAIEEYNSILNSNKEKISKVKTDTSTKLAELKVKFKEDTSVAKKDNDTLFKNKKEKEINEYKRFKSINSDKDSLKRRRDEYHIFMDNYSQDKENALNRSINSLTMDYESKVSSLNALRRREVDILKKEIKDAKEKMNRALKPYEILEREHNANIRKLNREKEREVLKASYIFFLKFIDDYYNMTSDIISNKLIQGLGTRVFSKNFKVEVPHDIYQIVDSDDGIIVKVESNLNYDTLYYVKCSYSDNDSQVKYIYLESDKELEVGKQLHITFDLSKCRITETDMNIRLY